jgi:hypothetical protein
LVTGAARALRGKSFPFDSIAGSTVEHWRDPVCAVPHTAQARAPHPRAHVRCRTELPTAGG